MIRWKDGKVDRVYLQWAREKLTWQESALADALDVAVAALRFYAKQEHLYGSLPDDWDECSDAEYAGWLWPNEPAEDLSWGVENGKTADHALRQIGADHAD